MEFLRKRPSNLPLLQRAYDESYQASLRAILLEAKNNPEAALSAWRTTRRIISLQLSMITDAPKTAEESQVMTNIMNIERQCHDRIAFLERGGPDTNPYSYPVYKASSSTVTNPSTTSTAATSSSFNSSVSLNQPEYSSTRSTSSKSSLAAPPRLSLNLSPADPNSTFLDLSSFRPLQEPKPELISTKSLPNTPKRPAVPVPKPTTAKRIPVIRRKVSTPLIDPTDNSEFPPGQLKEGTPSSSPKYTSVPYSPEQENLSSQTIVIPKRSSSLYEDDASNFLNQKSPTLQNYPETFPVVPTPEENSSFSYTKHSQNLDSINNIISGPSSNSTSLHSSTVNDDPLANMFKLKIDPAKAPSPPPHSDLNSDVSQVYPVTDTLEELRQQQQAIFDQIKADNEKRLAASKQPVDTSPISSPLEESVSNPSNKLDYRLPDMPIEYYERKSSEHSHQAPDAISHPARSAPLLSSSTNNFTRERPPIPGLIYSNNEDLSPVSSAHTLESPISPTHRKSRSTSSITSSENRTKSLTPSVASSGTNRSSSPQPRAMLTTLRKGAPPKKKKAKPTGVPSQVPQATVQDPRSAIRAAKLSAALEKAKKPIMYHTNSSPAAVTKAAPKVVIPKVTVPRPKLGPVASAAAAKKTSSLTSKQPNTRPPDSPSLNKVVRPASPAKQMRPASPATKIMRPASPAKVVRPASPVKRVVPKAATQSAASSRSSSATKIVTSKPLSTSLRASPARKGSPSTTAIKKKKEPVIKKEDPKTVELSADDKWMKEARQKVSQVKGIDQNAAEQIFNDVVVTGDPVRWDDIAGLEQAKNSLKETVVYPFLRPDLFSGLREPAQGMLLFGPPGTGKTMLARAVATESQSTFFSISASSLTSKYLGESEKLVRALFLMARALAPAIIFVDEIDSLLAARSDNNEHETSRRIKTEFLVQWSALQHAAAGKEHEDVTRVLVLAATNLPWVIDEAARRRFVRRQYIPLPEPETRLHHLRKLMAHQTHDLTEEDLEKLVKLTEGFSGSDLTALAKDAAMGPLRELGEKLLTTPRESIRPMGFKDFQSSLNLIRPSVSPEGLKVFEDWASMYGSSGA